jgi:flavorubredoxin
MEKVAKEAGMDLVMPPIAFKYMPDESDLKKCYEYGREFVKKL